jgi:hypothetical protein
MVKQICGGSGPLRGRQFVACLIGEGILVLTDDRAWPTFSDSCYNNVLAWYFRYEWSGFMDVTRCTSVRVQPVCFGYVCDE